MRRTYALLVIGLLIGGVVAWWLLMPPVKKNDSAGDGSIPRELLSRAVEVVAIAENGRDYRAAIDGWTELLQARPEDRALLLNQAVTVLKWIADTNSALAGGSVKAEKVAELEQQLSDANVEADRVLEKLTSQSSTSTTVDGTQVLLEAALLQTRARAVDDTQAIELRKSAVQKLRSALDKKPQQPMLAANLLGLAEDLRLDWPEVTEPATEAAYRAWKGEPRNLMLLINAGQGLADAKDKRLLEVIETSVELSKPLLPMLPAAKMAPPDELLKAVRGIVASGDWSKPPRVRQWFNILKGSSAYRADHDRLSPDIMALLDTSFLERWRGNVADSKRASSITPPELRFEVVKLEDALAGDDKNAPPLVAWYDYDVDRDFDVAIVRGNQLRIVRQGSANTNEISSLTVELPLEPTGWLIADLWTVDSPQRPRIVNNAAPADGTAEPVQPATDTTAQTPDANAPALNSNSHDTIQELVLWNAEKVCVVSPDPALGQLTILDDVPGLATLTGVDKITAIEIDSDGDLDFAVSTSTGIKLLQNNGNRSFEDITQYSSLPPAGWLPSRMIACDYDRDLDLDIICTSSTAPYMAVLENILHSQMRFRALDEAAWKSPVALSDLAVIELDGNASWDWCTLSAQGIDCVLTRTVNSGQVVSTQRVATKFASDKSRYDLLKVADLNLDGVVDVCVAGPSGLFCQLGVRPTKNNLPRTGFIEPGIALISEPVVGLDIQDSDGDGRVEILTTVNGEAHVVSVGPKTDGHFLEARIRGINDNRGGRINHYGIGSVLEVWADGQYQARVVESPMSHFGLPVAEATDLRVIFNNGLTQNVVHPPSDALIQEIQVLKGSCPFVYGWDGERFQMITDLLWNAPLGLQVARGKTLPDRRWENLLLPGRLVQPRNGAIELQVTEELWEIAYFDHMTLTAVDHPSQVDVWTNEKVGPPQMSEHRLYTASHPIRPIKAKDGYGRNVLPLLSVRDKQYVQAFQHQICQGLCEPHAIELTFDPRQLAVRNDLRLVLTGWMHPTDTSLNIGLSQNPDRSLPIPPSLWAPDSTGKFVCQQPFMGFPGGKPKTIVVDLQDVFAGDDTRLRIESSQQIYWDEAYIIANEPPVPLHTQVLPLQTAELHYRGFSRLMERASDQPHWYDYSRLSTKPNWPPLEGLATRYGDVLPHMQADDDHIVVMTSGDEMTMRFALSTQPLPEGWQRDYVLHSVGWDKDADINTLEGQSSLPLPYAGMRSYPPTFEQQTESDAVWEKNLPTLTDRQAYGKFWRP